MKRNVGHIDYARTENRTNDHYTGNQTGALKVQPEPFRWFCGLHDLAFAHACQATYACQAL